MSSAVIEFGLYLTYILIGVAILAGIVLPLINALNNPKALKTIGFGLAGLLIIFGLGWALSSYDVVSANAAEQGLDSSGVKLIGGVITMMYILFGVAVVGIVVTEVSKIFK